jgi:hypothetical protein
MEVQRILQGTKQDIMKETGCKNFKDLFNSEVDFNGVKMIMQSSESTGTNTSDDQYYTLIFK